MILILGLGNPGKEFENTRHNTGFLIIERLQKEGDFGSWQEKKKMQSLVSKGKISNKKIVLAKPQTFMNNSGKAAIALKKYYRVKEENIWVIHDDMDLCLLPQSQVRVSFNRGSAGHKGVISIIENLKTKNFVRLRVGIDNCCEETKKDRNWVLSSFSCSEKEALETSIKKCLEIIKGRLKSPPAKKKPPPNKKQKPS